MVVANQANKKMEVDPKQSKLIQTQKAWIAGRIRTMRESRGITQQELANRMEVHFTRVSDLEKNSTDFKISSLLRAAYALNVPMEMFMKGCPGWNKPGRTAQKDPVVITISMEELIASLQKSGMTETKARQVAEGLA